MPTVGSAFFTSIGLDSHQATGPLWGTFTDLTMAMKTYRYTEQERVSPKRTARLDFGTVRFDGLGDRGILLGQLHGVLSRGSGQKPNQR